MKTLSCDVAVIGAGTAGLAASRAAHEAGAEVLLIESGEPGTTCARVGCMPSKLLIAAAEVAHAAGTASVFGVQTAPLRIDGRAVLARVRAERDRFVRGVLRSYESIPAERRLRGQARFVDEHTLAVDGALRVQAKSIVIATGSAPAIPEFLAGVRDRVLTNDNLFELPDLPTSVAVVGAGPLGLELGQALHRLGVRVCIFDSGHTLGGLQSEAMNAHAQRIFAETLRLGLGVQLRAEAVADGVALHWKDSPASAEGSATFDHVLVAAGRPPNLASLDLDQTGLSLDEHGSPEFDRHTMRCGDSAIFIAGDASHDVPLLHEATDEGSIAGTNAATFPRVESRPRRVAMAVTFSDPQIAVVGESRRPGHAVGSADFGDQGRARVMNRACGVLHLYGDRDSGRIVGAEIIAPAAEHLAHLLAWAIQQRQRASDLLLLPFYHPTLEEGLRTALRDLCAQLHTASECREALLEFGPGG